MPLRFTPARARRPAKPFKPSGGSVSPLEAHAAFLFALIARQPDLTLDEIVAAMHKRRIVPQALPDRFQFETEFTMNTYVAIIGGKAVLTFRAVDDDQARAMIDDQEGSMRSDLKVLVDANGKPLWDGKSAIRVQEATAAQHAEWKRSRDQAISDGEIDLD